MKYENLPALTSKKEPNVVEITNRKLHPDSETGDKFTIPAERFIYPQVESADEMAQICGGAEQLLAVFNDHLRDAAVTEAKNSIRMASSGAEEDIVNSGIEKGKNFTFVETQKITAAEAKERFSELRTLASQTNLTDEELAAKVRALLGA